MKNLTTILFALVVVTVAYGCAEEPRSPYNSPEQQRSHAGGGQGELSGSMQK